MINQNHGIHIENEEQLYKKVIEYIRRYYPYLLIDSFQGEMQVHEIDGERSDRRLEAFQKGYTRGACDLMITNLHTNYKGLCIEFKNAKGTGRLKDTQVDWLAKKKESGYHIIVSNDYDDIVKQINEYVEGVRFKCEHCYRKFKTPDTRANHHKWIHRQ